MRIKIGTKLIACFIFIILMIVALGVYSVNVSRKSLQEYVGNSSMVLAEEMLRAMDKAIYLKIDQLQMYANLDRVKNPISESNKKFEELVDVQEFVDQKNKEWVAAPKDKMTPFMRGLINNQLSDSVRRNLFEFYVKKYGTKVFTQALITNKYGANIAQTGKTSDYRQDRKEWWQVSKEKGFHVGDIEQDATGGTSVIPIGVRVVDREGDFIGVIRVRITSEEVVRKTVIATTKYETTLVRLLTKNGRLIYSTNAFKLLEDVSGKAFFKKIKGESGSFISTEGAKERLFSFVHSKGYGSFEGLGWSLVVGHDIGEILKPSFILGNNIAVASLILIIFAILFAFLMSYSITKPIRILTRGAEIVSKGDLGHHVEVKSKDEIGSLGSAFNSMVGNLQKASLESERHNFINTGQSELDDHMRGDRPIDELCKNIITFVAEYLKVQVGTLYVNAGEGLFKLKAGYAYKTLKKLPNEFKTGEGLIGQAALEKKPKVLTNVPEDYITVISGLGEKKPRNILIAPFIYNETVSGVLEVGSFDEFTELQTRFMEQISEKIAIAINSAQASMQLQNTLEVSRKQAEELESQQEELKAANEELEEQTQRLQASEEELKAQQEELQSLNEELEEKARALEERMKSERELNIED